MTPRPWNTFALIVGLALSIIAWCVFGVAFGWAVGCAEGFVRGLMGLMR